ncbi:YmfQ family protein [Brevibacillus sp. M2.1A]|uniref:putative phage tail protein n=1 Tax=Brevibacillus sp. M2.1A TaxID=2738980 RepID=UPI00156B8B90|nr:putative phage tail protein [Brevibacillus sp. M2.1A]MCC8435490.1 YmfQ family protein [Brevibacillus sp. M2.1A]
MPADRILKYWPSFYQEVDDFKALADVEATELDDLDKAIQRSFDDEFVMTSGPEGIERREKMLGIQADPSTESLDFRKKRILNRYQTKPPFTIRWLQRQLNELVGAGLVIVNVDVQNFILYVKADIDAAAVFKEVNHTVLTVKPANLIYNQQTEINEGITLQENIYKSSLDRRTGLSTTWQLGISPFAMRGEEVLVK